MLFLPGPRGEVRDGTKGRSSHGNAITIGSMTPHTIPLEDGGTPGRAGRSRLEQSSVRRHAGEDLGAPGTRLQPGVALDAGLRGVRISAPACSSVMRWPPPRNPRIRTTSLSMCSLVSLALHRRHRLLPRPDHTSQLVIGMRCMPAGIGEIRGTRTRLPRRLPAAVGVVALDAMLPVEPDRLGGLGWQTRHRRACRRGRAQHGLNRPRKADSPPGHAGLNPQWQQAPQPSRALGLWEIEPCNESWRDLL